MENSRIKLCLATLDDCEFLYEWRNSEETRKYFFDPEPILWESHCKWLEGILLDERRFLMVGHSNGSPLGVLRYDIEDNTVECSVYLVPGLSGRGLGTALLKEGSEWVKKELPDIKQMIAKVLSKNISSIHAFTKAGYQEEYTILKYDL